MTRYVCWVDEAHWPGPDEEDGLATLVQFFSHVSKGFGQTTAALGSGLTQIGQIFGGVPGAQVPIRGATPLSNHATGLAIDLNAYGPQIERIAAVSDTTAEKMGKTMGKIVMAQSKEEAKRHPKNGPRRGSQYDHRGRRRW